MLTGFRDTDIVVAQQLDDRDLLNFCIANKNSGICQDEKFWKERFISKYGQYEKLSDKSWKKFYLSIVYFLDKAKNIVNKAQSDLNKAMMLAAERGDRDLVDFFIFKGADGWNWGMVSSAEGGHWDLVKFFISKGANNWNWGMFGAAQGGHRNLVDFFVEKGADGWNLGLHAASLGGHQDLVKFFQEKMNE